MIEGDDVTLGLDSMIDHAALGLSDDQVVEMYRMMLLARKLDDRMWALNRQGRVPFVVSVSGHEASQVGAAFALAQQHFPGFDLMQNRFDINRCLFLAFLGFAAI